MIFGEKAAQLAILRPRRYGTPDRGQLSEPPAPVGEDRDCIVIGAWSLGGVMD